MYRTYNRNLRVRPHCYGGQVRKYLAGDTAVTQADVIISVETRPILAVRQIVHRWRLSHFNAELY